MQQFDVDENEGIMKKKELYNTAFYTAFTDTFIGSLDHFPICRC